MPDSEARRSQGPSGHLDQGLFLDDRLGRDGCTALARCRHIVGEFRCGTARYRRMRRIFVASTPGEFLDFPPDIVEAKRHAMAVLDLDEYPDFAAVMEAAKDTSEKRGRVNREYARAQKMGYYVKPFAFAQFIPDIVAIHQSKTVRQGRAVQGEYYAKTVEQLGGAPAAPVAMEAPGCPQHQWQYWGVFHRVEGHRQGEVRTDEELVGYIRLRRQGESASYTWIMGHGDHLRHGVMYLLHYEIVAHMLRQSPHARPRYIVYLHYAVSGAEGIDVWKRRALFKPRYLHYVEDRPVCLPCDPPMPYPGEGLLALKTTLWAPWSRAAPTAKDLGVSTQWLKSLHQAWVIERTHAPSLTARMLRDGPNPPLEILRPLGSNLFPIELVDPAQKVAVVLHGATRGLDCLPQIRDAGAHDVAVFHPGAAEQEMLEELYGGGWAFKPLTTNPPADEGVLVIEGPAAGAIEFVEQQLKRLVGAFAGLLIVSLEEQVLAHFGYDARKVMALFGHYGDDPATARPLCERLQSLLARPVTFAGAYYRHGDPEAFWIALRLA